jgi:hypothetical protein
MQTILFVPKTFQSLTFPRFKTKSLFDNLLSLRMAFSALKSYLIACVLITSIVFTRINLLISYK